jgi:hypothetical protein
MTLYFKNKVHRLGIYFGVGSKQIPQFKRFLLLSFFRGNIPINCTVE